MTPSQVITFVYVASQRIFNASSPMTALPLGGQRMMFLKVVRLDDKLLPKVTCGYRHLGDLQKNSQKTLSCLVFALMSDKTSSACSSDQKVSRMIGDGLIVYTNNELKEPFGSSRIFCFSNFKCFLVDPSLIPPSPCLITGPSVLDNHTYQ